MKDFNAAQSEWLANGWLLTTDADKNEPKGTFNDLLFFEYTKVVAEGCHVNVSFTYQKDSVDAAPILIEGPSVYLDIDNVKPIPISTAEQLNGLLEFLQNIYKNETQH